MELQQAERRIFMVQFKSKKKIIKIIVIVAMVLVVANLLLNGINVVPFRFRNLPVSFLTSDLTWDSKPSDFILKYGLPEYIGEVSDITGERTFDFKFVYDEKDVSLSADNRGALNSEFHRYYFTIDCKSPEEASKYFDKCHEKMMKLYENEPDFEFEGTETETDYEFTDGNVVSYSSTNENGVIKTTIIDDDGNEILLEEADNIVEIKTKINEYDMSNTVGISYSLSYSEGESTVRLRADIMY